MQPGQVWEPGKAKWQGLFDTLWLDPDFRALEVDERLAYVFLRTGPRVPRCCLYFPDWHLFYEVCGVDKDGAKRIIESLGKKPWVLYESGYVWLVKGMRHDPTDPLQDTNRRKGVINELLRMPRLEIKTKLLQTYHLVSEYRAAEQVQAHGFKQTKSKLKPPDVEYEKSVLPDERESKELSAKDRARFPGQERLAERVWYAAPKDDKRAARLARLDVLEYWLKRFKEVFQKKLFVSGSGDARQFARVCSELGPGLFRAIMVNYFEQVERWRRDELTPQAHNLTWFCGRLNEFMVESDGKEDRESRQRNCAHGGKWFYLPVGDPMIVECELCGFRRKAKQPRPESKPEPETKPVTDAEVKRDIAELRKRLEAGGGV